MRRTYRNNDAHYSDYATLVRYDNVKLFFCPNLLRKWSHLGYTMYITPLHARNISFVIIISAFRNTDNF